MYLIRFLQEASFSKIEMARPTHSKLVNLRHEPPSSIFETQRRHFGGVLAHARSWIAVKISGDEGDL